MHCKKCLQDVFFVYLLSCHNTSLEPNVAIRRLRFYGNNDHERMKYTKAKRPACVDGSKSHLIALLDEAAIAAEKLKILYNSYFILAQYRAIIK